MEDLEIAKKIIEDPNFKLNSKSTYHNYSGIYLLSNENSESYNELLKNRNKILSVIASSDQVINMILGGSKELDLFDISKLPKYLLYLKLGALKYLNREEYLDFFHGEFIIDKKYFELYDKFRKGIPNPYLEFWDGLFCNYEWRRIVYSNLFNPEPFIRGLAIRKNTFLKENEFDKVKKMIPYININIKEGNILDIYSNYTDSYDLVYLSNIIYYTNYNDFKKIIDYFKLNKDGIVLNYLYHYEPLFEKMFSDSKYGIIEKEYNYLLIRRK